MPIPVDLSELPMNVRQSMHKVLTDECAAQMVQAKIRQRRIAKFYADNRPRAIEGIGGMSMAVDPFWVGYFNMQHGRQVFQDPDFMKFIAREDDSFRVRSGGTKIQVGFSSAECPASAGRSAKFRKRYEWPEAKR
jgi:hypothetical protein